MLFSKSRKIGEMRNRPRFHLCTIEGCQDTSGPKGKTGTLCLSKYNEVFQIHWAPLDGTRTEEVAAILNSVNLPKESDWSPSHPFVIDCSEISLLSFSEDPLTITISRGDQSAARKFKVGDTGISSLVRLSEQLILNGLAVPSPKEKYSFEFYGRPHKGFYTQVPMWFGIDSTEYANLQSFWTDVAKMMSGVIEYLNARSALPKDPAFPIGSAALASHQIVMETRHSFLAPMATRGDFKTVRAKEWVKGELLDPKGKGAIRQWNTVRRRISRAGCDMCLIKRILPYALGIGVVKISDETESKHERHKRWKEKFSEFQKLVKACNSGTNGKEKLEKSFKMITQDVMRTDRDLQPFKQDGGIGLTMMETILKVWVQEHASIGYVQGLNDLLVPFLLIFLPMWSDDGVPLDNKGKPMTQDKQDKGMSKAYWCFEAFLRQTKHEAVLQDPDKEIAVISSQVQEVLETVSPVAAIWICRHGLNNLTWCYSSILLLFKRTFPDVWSVWLRLLCSSGDHRQWLIYFIAAVLLVIFDKIALLPDCSAVTMIKDFPELAKSLDPAELGRVVAWIMGKHNFRAKPHRNSQ